MAKMALMGIFSLFRILLILNYNMTKASEEYVRVTVTDKESIVVSDGKTSHNKYLVYCEGEVFENTDSFIFSKYDSSDLQGKLVVGTEYTAQVAGWRIPWMSSYRNIISVQ